MRKHVGLFTDRERTLLVRAGMTDADLANLFGVKLQTIHKYWRRITQKTKTRNRRAALIKALQLGEITVRQLIT